MLETAGSTSKHNHLNTNTWKIKPNQQPVLGQISAVNICGSNFSDPLVLNLTKALQRQRFAFGVYCCSMGKYCPRCKSQVAFHLLLNVIKICGSRNSWSRSRTTPVQLGASLCTKFRTREACALFLGRVVFVLQVLQDVLTISSVGTTEHLNATVYLQPAGWNQGAQNCLIINIFYKWIMFSNL